MGIHPWQLANMAVSSSSEEDIADSIMNKVINMLEKNENKQVVAIGECGLDKLCTAPLQLQAEVFKRHVALSEQYRLPLIIHCVKALDELLYIKKDLSPTLPWIWHGFRGKPQQLQQLLKAGFYISFGFKYNRESLMTCPSERMFLETDDDPRPIHLLYEQVLKEREYFYSPLLF